MALTARGHELEEETLRCARAETLETTPLDDSAHLRLSAPPPRFEAADPASCRLSNPGFTPSDINQQSLALTGAGSDTDGPLKTPRRPKMVRAETAN